VALNVDELDTLAACLLAVDPVGLGGLCVRGPSGPAREALLARLRALQAPEAAWQRVPPHVEDERLLGGLDLGLSLAASRPVRQAGLLAQARGGVLLLPMAERCDPALAAKLALALDQPSAALCVVALDEGESVSESLPAALLERLALIVRPVERGLAREWGGADAAPPPVDVAAARLRLARIPCDPGVVEALCATAAALGIHSLRVAWLAWCAARAHAALFERDVVTQADAEAAARLVLAPRARALPPSTEPGAESMAEAASPDNPPPGSQREAPPAGAPDTGPDPAPQTRPESASDSSAETPSPPEPPPVPPDAAPPADASEPASSTPDTAACEDQLIAAARAAIPAGLLDSLRGAGVSRGASGGRKGSDAAWSRSGRPVSPRRATPRAGSRLDLLATLRAAIPWQRLRQQEREREGRGPAPTRLLLRRDDFHVRRHRRPSETTTVFVVDASGSQALHRLAEAKGAVELLLADCYVRRDSVALIAFRGTAAETLLTPTRSLVRARRSLASLPGGGGTPLAAGIDAATQLSQALQARDGRRAVVVFLTDARANIARDGSPGRARAAQDALAAAARLRGAGLESILIDTSPRPQPEGLAMAQALGARYVPLPQGGSREVHAAVSAVAAPRT
jgi:magnesium chelatase subunit D